MEPTRGKTHVLVVESNVGDLQRVGALLEGMFTWDFARSLPEAEQKLYQLRPRVVLISDSWGQQGVRDFCRRVRTGRLGREVVIVTMGRADPVMAEMIWGRESGVDLHLKKPIERAALHDCLRQCWKILKSGAVAIIEADADAARPSDAPSPTGGEAAREESSPDSQSRLREILLMEINAETIRKLFGGRRDHLTPP